MFELKEYREGGVWSLFELESMAPYERELYVTMTKQRVAERKEKADEARRAAGKPIG